MLVVYPLSLSFLSLLVQCRLEFLFNSRSVHSFLSQLHCSSQFCPLVPPLSHSNTIELDFFFHFVMEEKKIVFSPSSLFIFF